jgi:hypothetical protein
VLAATTAFVAEVMLPEVATAVPGTEAPGGIPGATVKSGLAMALFIAAVGVVPTTLAAAGEICESI